MFRARPLTSFSLFVSAVLRRTPAGASVGAYITDRTGLFIKARTYAPSFEALSVLSERPGTLHLQKRSVNTFHSRCGCLQRELPTNKFSGSAT
jgi:hypothetical protein